MRIGDNGVKIVKPEDAGFLQKPGSDAEIDTGYDDVEDYDENAVVRRKNFMRHWIIESLNYWMMPILIEVYLCVEYLFYLYLYRFNSE